MKWFIGVLTILIIAILCLGLVAGLSWFGHQQRCQQISEQYAAGLRAPIQDVLRETSIRDLAAQYGRDCG